VVNAAERLIEHGLDGIWVRFRRQPYIGAVLAGGVGLAVASVFGVGELAVAAGLGYAVYQMLTQRKPPGQAFKEALKVEKEIAEE